MFLRIFEANNKTYNIMESSNIDYEIAFDSFKNKIKEMAVGSIKRTGIKKIAKPVLLLTIIKWYRGWYIQTKLLWIWNTWKNIQKYI